MEALLAFANRGRFRDWMRLRQGTEFTLDAEPGSPVANELQEGFSAEREVLRKNLVAIFRREVTPDLRLEWTRRASTLSLTPQFTFIGERLETAYRHYAGELFASPPSGEVSYALLLLLDGGRPYGRDLCLCHLATCDKFFFARKPREGTGRTIRLYCPGTDHGARAHQAGASERVRRSRATQRATKQKRRK